jgi:cysteine desulfuration protein SufE
MENKIPNIMTFSEKQNEITEILNSMSDWHARYNHIIEIGQQLPPMPEHLKIQANRITSCTSRTYFYPEKHESAITIHGWSNSAIPAGLIALFKQLCDGIKITEIRSSTIDFHIKTGLINNLSLNRKTGFLEMLSKLNI